MDGGRVGTHELHVREVAVRLAVALHERGHRVHRLQCARELRQFLREAPAQTQYKI